MSKWLIFGLLTCMIGMMQAQPGVFQPLLELDPSISEQTDIHILSGEREITLIFMEGTEAQIFLLSPEMEVRNSFRIQELPPSDEASFLGFTNTPNALHFCYQDLVDGEYDVLSIEKGMGQMNWFGIDMGRLPRHNVYWGSFTHEGMLHVLRMPRGGNSVRLCRFEGGKRFDNQEFILEHPEILQKAQYQFVKVESDSSEGLESAYFPGKMYVQEDQVYLSLDELGTTHLLKIDLTTGQKTEWSVPAPSFLQDREELISVKNNSLILHDHLYQVAASQDSLKLLIRNLAGGDILKAFTYGAADAIDVLAGELVAQSPEGETILLHETRSWLNALSAHPYIALSGTVIQDSLLELVIGGVKPSHNLGLTGMVLEESIQTCYFPALLHLPSFLPTSVPPATIAEMRFPPPAFYGKPHLKGFAWQGQKHLLYYDPAVRKVILGVMEPW